jgi:Ca2+-binding EF-hand superfamily protein
MVLVFCSYIIAQLLVQALASTVNEEELADLKDQFDAIDVDKSGSISIEEMRHVRFRVIYIYKAFCAGTGFL